MDQNITISKDRKKWIFSVNNEKEIESSPFLWFEIDSN